MNRTEPVEGGSVLDLVQTVAMTTPGPRCRPRLGARADVMVHARRVAGVLTARHVQAGDRVAICVERNAWLPVLTLGVWGAGAAYIPVDPAYPEARIAEVLTSNLEAASRPPASSLSDAPAFFSSPGVVEACREATAFDVVKSIQRRNLLELGCGAGRIDDISAGSLVHPRRRDHLAPELSDAARASGLEKDDGIRFSVGDATAITAAPATYDNVLFAYNGIESIPTHEQRVQALREVHRVLKLGGRFVFSTKSLFTPLYLLEGALKPRVKRVLRVFGVRYPRESILPFGEILWKRDGKAIRCTHRTRSR